MHLFNYVASAHVVTVLYCGIVSLTSFMFLGRCVTKVLQTLWLSTLLHKLHKFLLICSQKRRRVL